NDLQMAPMAMPEMAVGENVFTYTDRTPGERRGGGTPPRGERGAPAPPAAPPRGGGRPRAGGGATPPAGVPRRAGAAPAGAGGARIGDYQFELSRRADMRIPLSMDFYKLVSRTADAKVTKDKDGNIARAEVEPRYALPQPGLLAPDQKYYWRVRAMSGDGVWGPARKTGSFTARCGACPVARA